MPDDDTKRHKGTNALDQFAFSTLSVSNQMKHEWEKVPFLMDTEARSAPRGKTKTKTKTRMLFRFRSADLLHHTPRRNKTYDKFVHSGLQSPAVPVVAPGSSVATSCAPTPLSPPATPPQLPLRPLHQHLCRLPLQTRTSVAAACVSARLSPPAAYSHLRLRPRTFNTTVHGPVLARMVNRKTHGSQRRRKSISGRISRQAGGPAPGAADMAELLHAILRAAIDAALVGRQIEPEPSGRESDRLLRREPLVSKGT
jgi:hypothetical protein